MLRDRRGGSAACTARRPPAWKEFDPLDIACAAALNVHPGQVRPELVVVEPQRGSAQRGAAPCPLAAIQTFRGVAVRVYEPLREVIERLVREGAAAGGALSRAHRQRLIEAVGARLPVVEVWHDLLHYTDRQHFIPWREHRVRRMGDPARYGALAFGIFVGDRLAAYADVVPRGDYACAIGVFTEEEFRGQGMARSLVSAATRAVLRAGRIPLYSTDESNTASLAVCRSLGYIKFGQDLYCFLAPEEERARREEEEREAERRAADIALHRWIID